MKKKKRNTEVIKHSSSIQITNRINLIERKSWNILLANAFDELPTHETHTIRVKDLAQLLEYDSNDEEHLKESLRKLNTTQIEWNILNKDKKVGWGVTTLLAEARFEKGVCIYGFSSTLRERLYNPEMYAKINLLAQNKIKSKYSLALYELFLDYLNNKNNYGETPLMSVEKFRDLMGIEEHEYSQFKRLNNEVIKPSIKEINMVTNLSVKFEMEKEGRKVTGLKFFITKREDFDDLINFRQLKSLESISPKEASIISIKSDKIKKFCQENKVSYSLLETDIQDYGEDYIEYVIDSCSSAKGIKKLSGFFVSSLKNRVFLEPYKLIQEQQEKTEKQRLKELEKIFEEKLLLVYSSEEEKYLRKFLQEHEELFLNLIEKHSQNNPFIRATVQRADKDIKKLLNNQFIIHSLYNDVKDHNDYLFPSIENWQKDPENAEKISEIRKQVLV